MKVAVCFSGGVRNFKDTFPYFEKNFIEIYNPDVFVYGVQNIDGSVQNIKDIESLYKPKKLVINTDEFYEDDVFKNHISNPTLKCMYHNVHQSNLMKKDYEEKNSFIYDVVLRARFDTFLVRPIEEDEINSLIDDEILTTRDWCGFNPDRFVCDFFAFGNSQTMDKYSETILNRNLFDTQLTMNNGEDVLGYHLRKKNIKTKHIGFEKNASNGSPFTFDYPSDFNFNSLPFQVGSSVLPEHYRLKYDSPKNNWRNINLEN